MSSVFYNTGVELLCVGLEITQIRYRVKTVLVLLAMKSSTSTSNWNREPKWCTYIHHRQILTQVYHKAYHSYKRDMLISAGNFCIVLSTALAQLLHLHFLNLE